MISLHCVLSAFMKGPSFTNPKREVRGMEDKVKTARLVQQIGEAVQAQVNLAKLDIHARKQRDDARERAEQLGRRPPAGKPASRQARSVSATNIMAARERLEDAMWEPWLRAKARQSQLCTAVCFLTLDAACRLAACCFGWCWRQPTSLFLQRQVAWPPSWGPSDTLCRPLASRSIAPPSSTRTCMTGRHNTSTVPSGGTRQCRAL